MISKVLIAAAVASLSLSAAASPAAVKPLTVKNGTTCKLDTDCTDGNYCRQTPAQRKAGAVAGVCGPKRDLGAVCYKDGGCLSNNCVNSQCAYLAPTAPQIQCTRKAIGSLGSLSLDDYDALDTKPTQPYLTFNKHYATISDGSNREVMTTSGPKSRIRFEYWECPSDSMGFPNGGAGQLRVPSKGQKLCLTGDVSTEVEQCQKKKKRGLDDGCGLNKRDNGYAPLYVAPCKFDDNSTMISNQYWYGSAIRRFTGREEKIVKRETSPVPTDDPSVPFFLIGASDNFYRGVPMASTTGNYSTWLLEINGSQNDNPVWLLPNSTTY